MSNSNPDLSGIIKQLNQIESNINSLLDQVKQIKSSLSKELPQELDRIGSSMPAFFLNEKTFLDQNESSQNEKRPEIDITDLWYDTFKKGYGEILLDSGKIYSISTVKRQKIHGKVRVSTNGEPAGLWIGKENYILFVDSGEDNVLFLLDDGAEVLIENVNPSMRAQSSDVQQRYSIDWFLSVQNPNANWVAILKDCDTTRLGKNGGFGSGILYGGIKENYIAFINYRHAGPMLMELKNPYPNGVLYAVLDNVKTDYSDPSDWVKRVHLTTGRISHLGQILSLTGGKNASVLFNYFFNIDKGANRTSLCHIGRFTFIIDTIDAVIDLKKIQLRPSPKKGDQVYIKDRRFFFSGKEPHAGDNLVINGVRYTIAEKLKTEWNEWTNEWGNGPHPQTARSPQCFMKETVNLSDGDYTLDEYSSSFDLFDTEQDIYLIFKDDMNFRTTLDTKFGDVDILLTRGGFHIVYNHDSVSMWARNVELQGYYRESTEGSGKCLGFNMVNCKGFENEFRPKEITTDKPMPERISRVLSD